MSMLVVIRNIKEMDTALEAASKYVIFMQKLFDSNQQENWIRGLCWWGLNSKQVYLA
jgi:hypothetical protein